MLKAAAHDLSNKTIMFRITHALTLMTFAFFSQFGIAQVNAPAGLTPAGLTPGDTFFVAFVTSGTTPVNQTSAVLEAFADAQAALGPDTSMVTGWTALMGHIDGTLTTTSAFGGTTDRPIYLVDGTLVANDRASMFATPIPQTINVNEDGNPDPTPGGATAFTGFLNDGAAADAASAVGSEQRLGRTGPGDGCRAGNVANTLSWANGGSVGCANSFKLYVLSPLLVVPVAVSGSAIGLEW